MPLLSLISSSPLVIVGVVGVNMWCSGDVNEVK